MTASTGPVPTESAEPGLPTEPAAGAPTGSAPAGAAPADRDKLDAGVLKVAGVVVIGAIMAILDVTVVSVALPTFQREFHATYATVAWTMTAYTLALATVIPITGWASDRFGTKRLYLASIVMFVAGSALCSVADGIGMLIAFRVLQGLGGGMLMPLGMTIMTRAAGPDRVGRVMAVLGIPMLLGPIGGPILGGWLIGSFSWHWIFLINVPIGIIAFLLSLRVLPKDRPSPTETFDFLGMALLSPGLALFLFGVSSIPEVAAQPDSNIWTSPRVMVSSVLGLGLTLAFVWHALRKAHPLIDLHLFRNKNLTVSVITMTLFTVAFMGSMLLIPSYFLQVRDASTLDAGLLLIPQGVGAMITMPMAGALTDRIGPGKLVLSGIVLITIAMVCFTQLAADSSWLLVLGALFVSGLGMGMTMMPIMSAALANLRDHQIARGSTMMNIVQQVAGSIGTAVMSVVLTNQVLGNQAAAAYSAVTQGLMAPDKVPAQVLTQGRIELAHAFGHTYIIALVLTALCLVPAFLLPRKRIEAASPATPVAMH